MSALAPRLCSGQAKARGAAIVEFALVVPLFVLMILFSMYFTELIHAKLKLQEASRYVAWQMTSYVLTDYGQGNHGQAFDIAMNDAVAEASTRFRDLDSVEDNASSGFVVDYSGISVTMQNKTVPFADTAIASPGAVGGLSGQVTGAIGGGANWAINQWGFNPQGEVQAQVSIDVANKLLPRTYSQEGQGGFNKVSPTGDVDLTRLGLKNRFSVVASGWDLEDGGDAMIRDNLAGNHSAGSLPTGLYTQVGRMKFLGILNALQGIPGMATVVKFFQNFGVPAFTGTFVVAHNYKGTGIGPDRDCYQGGPGSSPNPAQDGLNNLKKYSTLDWDLPKCFDTAPFRDVADYSQALYVQMFAARGPNFMGCPNPQADDPTSTLPPNVGDRSQDRTPCVTTGP